MTVFFTTHYMEEADRVADEIAIIDRGKIVAQRHTCRAESEDRKVFARRRIHLADRPRDPRGSGELS